MAKGGLGLRDAILADAIQPLPGPQTWFSRLPEAEAAEVAQLRDDWRAGIVRVTCWHMARLIARHLTDRGHHAHQQAVARWLRE